MKIIKAAWLMTLLVSGIALADSVPEGWWASGTKLSGTVTNFKSLPINKTDLVAELILDKIDIPKPYNKLTSNCKAYLIEQNSEWMLHDLICDYGKDEIVKIYIYPATLSQDPLNKGDQIVITTESAMPVAGYFIGFTYKKSEVKEYW